ncbi:MAG: hypothetical protein J7K46_00680 [Bacteroidales bacterium]|nr:hypothetical protein [Bacteroidales bacterium]
MLQIIIYISLGFIFTGIFFSTLRFIFGPTAADRTVALDTLTTIAMALLALLSFIFNRYIYIDIALVYGVLGFIGVLVIARYLEGAL